MKKNTVKNIILLCLVPFVMVLGNSMLIPVLPAIKSALEISQLKVGLLITVFSVPAGIIIPFAGIASDHLGRVKIMAPALIIYGLGGLVAGLGSIFFKQPYYIILAGRILQGIGAGGTYQLAMALAGDLFKSQERTKVLGFLESSNGLGKVISPLAGAAVGLISWYAPFFVYGVLAIPVGIAIWLILDESTESLKKQSFQEYKNAVKEIFQKKGVSLLVCFLAGMVALFVLFGILSNYSDVLEQSFKIKGFLKGIVIAGPVLAMTITAFSLGILLEKTNKHFKTAILIGLCLIFLGQMGYMFFNAFWVTFFSVVFIGLGVGSVLPSVNTLVTSSVSTKRRGVVTCLYGTVRFFGVALGPPSYGFIENVGKKIPLGIFSGVVAISLVLAFLLIKEKLLVQAQN